MIILGLHFGHDGAVAVLRDGKVLAVALTERHVRVKHATSLHWDLVVETLADAGVDIAQVAFCAVTSTQRMPLLQQGDGRYTIAFDRAASDRLAAPAAEVEAAKDSIFLPPDAVQDRLTKWRQSGDATASAKTYVAAMGSVRALATPDRLPRVASWGDTVTLESLGRIPVRARCANDALRAAFHYPLTLSVAGRTIPGAFVDHHAAHAADVFYQSAMGAAAIFTYDGSPSTASAGMLFYGVDGKIFPLAEPHVGLGWFYNLNAETVGLNYDAGKLMGLAPYGTPRFFDRKFVGTAADPARLFGRKGHQAWQRHCIERARADGLDLSALGKRDRLLEAINADLAASTHQVFEETALAVVKALGQSIDREGFVVDGICMSGGCALSCPTNTRIANETGFGAVFVEPSCDDSGLAAGSALWAYHNLFNQPREIRSRDFPTSPYMGLASARGAEAQVAAGAQGYRIDALAIPLAGQRAAADLAADRTVGWFEGRSEIGPRALGHRSLLANSTKPDNWARVNRLKGREAWRPFAPAVLEEDAATWFKNMPLPSPYMLFTGDVIDPGALPAITHVDGTARVQTVTAHCGGFHDILSEFRRTTGCSVVMNTSLNGPGEPIVETPAEAFAFFAGSDLDVLYLNGLRLAKAG